MDARMTVQEEPIKRVDSILGSIATAKDIAVEQLPDIAYQFVAYNRIYLILFIAIQVFLIRFLKEQVQHLIKQAYERGYNTHL
jgi:hypothetical protein